MTGLTNYSANNVLNHLAGRAAMPALPAVWLALFTAVGTDAGTGFTEVSGGSYARLQVAGTATTNGTTSTAQAVINIASVPAWIGANFRVLNAAGGLLGTVLSKTGTTVTLTGNSAIAIGNGDVVTFSAFDAPSGTGPATIASNADVSFIPSTGSWGTVIAWGLYDASTSGNLTQWDYLGNFAWLPATVSLASPGSITAKAHGYANGDSFVFSTEYGGTAPSFGAGNYTGLQTVAGSATDSFNVTGVNTSSTGSGSVRKVASQSIPSGITATFSAGSMQLQAA